MLRNYLSVTIRALKKHRFYTFINVFGLSVGLTCFLMISLLVIDELSFDAFQEDIEHVYRMDFSGTINGNSFITCLAGPATAEAMIRDFPEVTDALRLRSIGDRLIKRKDEVETFKEGKVVYAEKNFFQFFDIPLIIGNPETALEKPRSIAISESAAKKIFNDEDPIGQLVTIDNGDSHEITAVFKDMPTNMHFHYDFLFSMEGLEEAQQGIWLSFNFNTYLKLTPETEASIFEAKFPTLIEKYLGPEIQQFLGQSITEFYESGNTAGFELFPMKDIHLYSDKLGELEQNGSIRYVYIFGAIAMFILILACINFMNLSTARSANRAKEVGVRKVLGAYRQHLIQQFMSEAFTITFISILLAFGLTYALLPSFNTLSDKAIQTSTLFSPFFYAIMFGVLLTVGFLAGSYPAFYLSKFRPVDVLKGKLNLGLKSGGIRSTLVVIQFSISIIMMIGTAIVFDQLSYIQNKKLGYDKEQIFMIEDAWLLENNLDAFKNEVINLPGVENGTIASFLPVGTTNNNNLWFKGQTAGTGDNYVMHNYRIDENYIATLGMKMKLGRAFSVDFPNDSTKVLMNESAAKQFGFTDPVGSYISTYDGSRNEPVSLPLQIIGIVEDFHFSTMRESIGPLIFTLDRARGFISFKLKTDDINNTVERIEDKWNEMAAGQPFSTSFMDDRFDNLYESEQRIGRIFGVFAFLAIFIACLGLYGLAAFSAEQKTKEIGIRKVLGASIMQIVALLGKEFLKLVIISFFIGSIVAFFTMKEWLNDFESRVEFSPMTFILTGLIALSIAWLTMSFQSVKTARTNPVKALKDE